MPIYEAGSRKFNFDVHRSGFGRPNYFAVSVKWYGDTTPTAKQQRKIDRLVKDGHVKKDSLEAAAYEYTQTEWWDWTCDLASEYGLGRAESSGRSGGWLILLDYSATQLEILCDDHNAHCINCKRPYETHVSEQCLFSPLSWVAQDNGCLEMLDLLETYAKEVRDSLQGTWLAECLSTHLDNLIENKWSECYPQGRRRLDDRVTITAP